MWASNGPVQVELSRVAENSGGRLVMDGLTQSQHTALCGVRAMITAHRVMSTSKRSWLCSTFGCACFLWKHGSILQSRLRGGDSQPSSCSLFKRSCRWIESGRWITAMSWSSGTCFVFHFLPKEKRRKTHLLCRTIDVFKTGDRNG